jgi:hypothetical protein
MPERVNAATVADHIGRFGALAEAGVQTAIVSLPNADDEAATAVFGEVIAAFPTEGSATWPRTGEP